MALLDVAGVSKRFGGVEALAEVSLRVHHGEVVGLIGPNGAGKTTLFNCISGVLAPDRGQVRFADRDITALPPHRRARLGIGRTFQNLQLFSRMTVLENLEVAVDVSARRGIVADALRLPRARREERRAEERARAVLHFLGLEDVASVAAGALPVGQQRRVELGRVLCLRPRLVLLDEPAAGLDAGETGALAELLLRARERFALSMLLVDHDMALVMRVCDYIYVLDFGRLIAAGPPLVVRDDPAVVAAYLGEAAA